MNTHSIFVFGDSGVGKSSTIIQLIQNQFVEELDPTIDGNYHKLVTIDNENCILDIHDTVYNSYIGNEYIHNGTGFVFIFSLSSKRSFDKIAEQYNRIVRIKGDSIPRVLLGNKCDLNLFREISTEEAQELAKEMNCEYYEISAKEGINIEAPFFHLVREIRTSTQHTVINPVNNTK